MMKKTFPLVLLCLFHTAVPAQGQLSQTTNILDDSKDWIDVSFHWLEEQRNYISSHVSASSTAIDAYLARDVFDSSHINESYLRMNLNYSFSTGYDEEADISLKTKLEVPSSKHKYKIFFDSDPDDFDDISDRRRDTPDDPEEEKNDSAILGLSYLGETFKDWSPKISVGARLKLPLDPYVKMTAQTYTELDDLWQSRLVLSSSYYDSKGWRAGLEYDIYRPINDDDIFRISNEAQFLDSDNTWEFYHSYSYYQRFERSSMEYSVAISGKSKPNPRTSKLWIRTQWRKRLYKDWLFGKISPEISFPRDRDFADTYSIFFELEVYFSEGYLPN